ncbi:hypothetical protein G3435_16170 [Pseudomonas sp. MAFF212428]|uniref:Uncharacterized protein n=1 Tax=Pseudomonas brassicae TaxID=2708063 RepID=A0A6M0CUI5_9PSED|nr:hypothetical protein [Pseudomonas brassicae]
MRDADQGDAAALAVPTAQVDRQVREDRLKALESAGLTLLGVAASFVPGISQVMLATTVGQLLGEVFEGVRDWSHGQRTQALQHLLGVGQALAAGVVLTAGVSAAVMALKRSAFVDRLMPIMRGAGQYRLWHADLAAYQYPGRLPLQAQVRSDGLIQAEGRLWLRQDAQVYEVQRSAGAWCLRHPLHDDAYAPSLEHNGEAAWRLPGEHPLLWQERLAMLRRFGPQAEGLTDAVAEQVLDVVGVDADMLRGLHVENRRLPAALSDTLARLRLDARIDAFFQQLDGGTAPDALDADLYRLAQAQLHGAADAPGSVAQRMREQAPRLRDALFAQQEAARESRNSEYVNLVQRDFPGLPGAYAQALIDQATSQQLQTMRFQARIPLALAEQVRGQLREVRLNRALDGLCLRNAYNVDSVRLAFGLLRRMPGWPAGLGLDCARARPVDACSNASRPKRIHAYWCAPRVRFGCSTVTPTKSMKTSRRGRPVRGDCCLPHAGAASGAGLAGSRQRPRDSPVADPPGIVRSCGSREVDRAGAVATPLHAGAAPG